MQLHLTKIHCSDQRILTGKQTTAIKGVKHINVIVAYLPAASLQCCSTFKLAARSRDFQSLCTALLLPTLIGAFWGGGNRCRWIQYSAAHKQQSQVSLGRTVDSNSVSILPKPGHFWQNSLTLSNSGLEHSSSLPGWLYEHRKFIAIERREAVQVGNLDIRVASCLGFTQDSPGLESLNQGAA